MKHWEQIWTAQSLGHFVKISENLPNGGSFHAGMHNYLAHLAKNHRAVLNKCPKSPLNDPTKKIFWPQLWSIKCYLLKSLAFCQPYVPKLWIIDKKSPNFKKKSFFEKFEVLMRGQIVEQNEKSCGKALSFVKFVKIKKEQGSRFLFHVVCKTVSFFFFCKTVTKKIFVQF